MKILLLSRYNRLGASSRLRTMQYLPSLTDAGLDVTVAPLFNDTYLNLLYQGKITSGSALRAVWRRLGQLRAAKDFDLVWLEKEALPWIPWWIERTLLDHGVPIVSDYDDAIFHRYDQHTSKTVQRFLGDKVDRVMAASALVIAGNAYLADRAKAAGAKKVRIVPTVVDLSVYAVAPRESERDRARIGWIGTPSTWSDYMEPMVQMLTQVASANGARLWAIGASQMASENPFIEVLDWSEDREVKLIQGMDIGIMPIPDTPFARGKCGYKLIQYMACGLPVVASPVGANCEIVEHGVNGFLAANDLEWREALTKLLHDPDLRQRMGEAGRKEVEQRYSLQVYGPRVTEMLREIALVGRRSN